MQTKKDAERFWTMPPRELQYLRKHSGKKKTAPFIDDITVNPKRLPEFLPELNKVMAEYKLTYTIQGHMVTETSIFSRSSISTEAEDRDI